MTEWTAPVPDRGEPEGPAPERQALEDWVDYHRMTLLHKCSGLTAAQLKERSVPPSALSLLGLVRHMAEVERWWFRRHVDGEDLGSVYAAPGVVTDPEADWDVDAADAAADLDAYRRECAAAKAAAAPHPLDEVVRSVNPRHPERTYDVRWIYLHMIEEYARHNGHADLLRERIDGATGD